MYEELLISGNEEDNKPKNINRMKNLSIDELYYR